MIILSLSLFRYLPLFCLSILYLSLSLSSYISNDFYLLPRKKTKTKINRYIDHIKTVGWSKFSSPKTPTYIAIPADAPHFVCSHLSVAYTRHFSQHAYAPCHCVTSITFQQNFQQNLQVFCWAEASFESDFQDFKKKN